MRRLLALVLLILGLAIPAKAQTTVTMTVTDGGSQVWANASYTLSSLGLGVAPITGSLNSGGTATITVPHSSASAAVGDQWTIRVCPIATSPCYTQTSVIASAATQTITVTPPAISIPVGIANANPGTPPSQPFIAAYADAEITGAVVGTTYYNTTSSAVRACSALPCSGASWVAAGGSPVGQQFNVLTFGGFANTQLFTGLTTHTSASGCNTAANTVCTTGTPVFTSAMVGQTIACDTTAGVESLATSSVTAFQSTSLITVSNNALSNSSNVVQCIIGGSGTAGDQTGINAAVTALNAVPQGCLFFPPGNYFQTAQMAITVSGLTRSICPSPGARIFVPFDFPYTGTGVSQLHTGNLPIFGPIIWDMMSAAPAPAGAPSLSTCALECQFVQTDNYAPTTTVSMQNWTQDTTNVQSPRASGVGGSAVALNNVSNATTPVNPFINCLAGAAGYSDSDNGNAIVGGQFQNCQLNFTASTANTVQSLNMVMIRCASSTNGCVKPGNNVILRIKGGNIGPCTGSNCTGSATNTGAVDLTTSGARAEFDGVSLSSTGTAFAINTASGATAVEVGPLTYTGGGAGLLTGAGAHTVALTHTPNTCYAASGTLVQSQNLCNFLADQALILVNVAALSGGAAPANSSCTVAPVVTIADQHSHSGTLTITTGKTSWVSNVDASSVGTQFTSGDTITTSIGTFTCATPPANFSVTYTLISNFSP